MYTVDEKYNLITDPDLSKGYLEPCTIINPDAKPVDNINKFAWAAENYIEAQKYVLNKPMPEPQSPIEERISDCELVLAEIMGGAL